MTVLSSLPPAFLLPAWSRAQLALLNVNSNRTAQLRCISRQRTLNNEAHQELDGKDGRDYIGSIETPYGTRKILSFASRREVRFLEGTRQIKERLSRKQPQLTKFLRSEKELEQRAISEYKERKKQNQQFPQHDRRLGRQVKHLSTHLEAKWTDDADDSAVTPVKFRRISTGSLSGQNDPTNPQPSLRSQIPSERSLLEELFPGEVTKLHEPNELSKKVQSQTEAPELPLPILDNLQDDNVLSRKPSPSPRMISYTPQHPLRSMLILENALPNLIEADFRRVTPTGAHIEDWKGISDPIVIVPARIKLPTECTGKYYLLFQTIAHAKAWRSRVEHIHQIFSEYLPNSIDAHVIPPSGFKAGGEDIGKLLREYSIFSPGIKPKMTLYTNPHADPTIRQEVNMVESRMQSRNNGLQPGRSVLLWIDGWTFGELSMIVRMIAVDGRLRHGAWGDPTNKRMVEDYVDENARSQDDNDADTGTKSRGRQRYWMVTLRDQAEARRFVRAWHNRAFPAWEQFKQDDSDEPWPLVKTELLW